MEIWRLVKRKYVKRRLVEGHVTSQLMYKSNLATFLWIEGVLLKLYGTDCVCVWLVQLGMLGLS